MREGWALGYLVEVSSLAGRVDVSVLCCWVLFLLWVRERLGRDILGERRYAYGKRG